MADKKNRAVLYYQGQSFIIWQDDKDNWFFTYGNLVDVNTQSKDLQRSLNIVYESIRDNMPRKTSDDMRAGGLRITKRGRDHRQPRKPRPKIKKNTPKGKKQ